MRLLYSIALYLLLPFILLRLLWRSRHEPQYRARILERFGYIEAPRTDLSVIWVHAVSAGEVMAARPLITCLLDNYPEHSVLVTTTTPAGAKLVGDHFDNRVKHAWAPWDLPGVSRRFLARTRSCLLVLMETELWPNWLYECQRAGCRTLLANARLSERSARRYRRGGVLVSDMLARLDVIACQTPEAARRFAALGVRKQVLTITGSTKYEPVQSAAAQKQGLALGRALAAPGRVVVIACSTHPAEEEAVLTGFGALYRHFPGSVLLLVPRHPRRAQTVARRCEAEGFAVVYRSSGELPNRQGGVVLCDTMGELATLCGAASAAFIGGSLAPRGGQNPLDAACWGLPLLMGPHRENFADMAAQLQQAGALQTVMDGEELGQWLKRLAEDEALASRMGRAGLEVIERNRGAAQKLAPLLATLLCR